MLFEQVFLCFDKFIKSKTDDKMILYLRATGERNKKQYGNIFLCMKFNEFLKHTKHCY